MGQPGVSIRIYHERDRDAVVALWRDCGLVVPWNDPVKDISRKMSRQPELFFVAECEGSVVGTAMAGYGGHRGEVYYVAVHPALSGKGVARTLMSQVETALAALGCPKVNVMVRRSNIEAAGFYEAIGYSEDDVAVYGKRLKTD